MKPYSHNALSVEFQAFIWSFGIMKKVTLLIVLACVVVGVCMVSLVRSGISLRSALLIKPSEWSQENSQEAAQAVFYRLFPAFQSRDLLVVGVDQPTPRVTEFLEHLKANASDFYKKPIKTFDDSQILTAQAELESCAKTCWVFTETQSTSDIAPMPSVLQLAGLDEKNRFTLSIFEFEGYDEKLIPTCEQQKRLTLECLKNLAIKEAQRKMKDPNKKYFFMKQYLERDYFLFIQK